MFRGSLISITLSVFFLSFSGCVSDLIDMEELKTGEERMHKQLDIMNELSKNPDIPAWVEQREHIYQAMGDKIFDKDFDTVFNAAVTAFATLEVKVENMERISGYISGSGLPISSELYTKLSREGLVEYCKIKGFDTSLLEKKSKYEMDLDTGYSWGRYGTGITISLTKLGPSQTKMKILFNGVYYPNILEECYKVIWQAIDKQIFLDKNLETPQQ
ncbi:MAG TPA: hypothetical protein PLX23_09890 [Candidatus Hydrogenedens sp.]|nr:hypothetical protein [Candidatus Hydrogenedens sp.]